MNRSTRASMITQRAEACLRKVQFTAGAVRPMTGGSMYANRQQVLLNIRHIKQQAAEAECLLRSLDRDDLPEGS